MTGPPPVERRGRGRLLALGLGGAVSTGALAALEARMRAEEAGETRFVADPPGVLYAYTPEVEDRNRGWVDGRLPRPRPPGFERVVFVGDSVTYGVNVSPKECWPGVVTTWLTAQAKAEQRGAIHGMNFGMNGYDASQVAALVTGGLDEWEPDVVAWGLYANDAAPTQMLYRATDGQATWVRPTVPADLALLSPGLDGWLVGWSATWRRLLGARFSRDPTATPGGRDDRALVDDALAALRGWSEARGVPVVVVALPPHVLADLHACPASFGGSAERCGLSARRHAANVAAAQASGLPTSDALPALRATGQPHFHPPTKADPDHPNADGQRIFAEVALPLVQQALGWPTSPPLERPIGPKARKSSRDHPRPDKPPPG